MLILFEIIQLLSVKSLIFPSTRFFSSMSLFSLARIFTFLVSLLVLLSIADIAISAFKFFTPFVLTSDLLTKSWLLSFDEITMSCYSNCSSCGFEILTTPTLPAPIQATNMPVLNEIAIIKRMNRNFFSIIHFAIYLKNIFIWSPPMFTILAI